MCERERGYSTLDWQPSQSMHNATGNSAEHNESQTNDIWCYWGAGHRFNTGEVFSVISVLATREFFFFFFGSPVTVS